MKTILYNKNLFLILSMFLLSSVSAQTAFKGLDESLVNVLPANEFDFAGTWTAYIYSVEYDKEAESVSRFEVIDSVHSVFYHRLVGFPTKAYRILSMNNQSYWEDAVINLAAESDEYQMYWLGLDSLKAVSTITTYGEMAIHFNIDVEDKSDAIDNNLFIELVRNEPSRKK